MSWNSADEIIVAVIVVFAAYVLIRRGYKALFAKSKGECLCSGCPTRGECQRFPSNYDQGAGRKDGCELRERR